MYSPPWQRSVELKISLDKVVTQLSEEKQAIWGKIASGYTIEEVAKEFPNRTYDEILDLYDKIIEHLRANRDSIMDY